jgi:Coenzyme PQQ synthesis protein D (PqqD)
VTQRDDSQPAQLPEVVYQKPRRKAVREHHLWDEVLLYFPDRETAVSLNRSAKAIWELCDGQHSLVEISQELAQRVGCTSDALLPDVQAAILRLREQGLLEPENAPPSSPKTAS